VKRREFLEATAAAFLVAGCGGGGSDSKPSEHAVLRVSDEEVYAADVTGNVFRAHRTANTVSRLGAGGAPLWTVGSRGTATLQFDHPVSLTADARGRLLVLDRGNGRVQVLDAATGPASATSISRATSSLPPTASTSSINSTNASRVLTTISIRAA